MTELEQKLNAILEEKNTKIIPENIKEGVTIFGINGQIASDNKDTKIEYLQAKGPIIFNTGLRHTANTNIEAKFRQLSTGNGTWAGLFGARNSNYQSNAFVFFTRFLYNGNSNYFAFCRTGNETVGTPIFDADVTLTINGKNATYTDGTRTYTITTTGKLDAGANDLLLMSINTAGADEVTTDSSSCDGLRIYYYKIFEGDTLIKHYVPYKKSSGEICFLDLVSNTTLSYGGIVDAGPDIE